MEGANNESSGTYGFDGNMAFVRRRLAVVNEYKVTSDGPNSRNLHVKYTKQYHNPTTNVADKRLSVSSTASSASTLDTDHSLTLGLSPSMLSSLNSQALGLPLSAPPMMAALPARSASLFRGGVGAPADPHVQPFAGMLPFGPIHSDGSHTMRRGAAIDQRIGMGLEAMDGLGLATRDLSTLSLLPDRSGHMMAGQGYTGSDATVTDAIPLDIANVGSMLSAIDASLNHMSNSPLSSSSGSNYSSAGGRPSQDDGALRTARRGPDGASDERPAKRHRSQSTVVSGRSASTVGPSTAYGSGLEHDLNQVLVEDFLSNVGVSDLLRSSWRPDSAGSSSSADAHHAVAEGGVVVHSVHSANGHDSECEDHSMNCGADDFAKNDDSCGDGDDDEDDDDDDGDGEDDDEDDDDDEGSIGDGDDDNEDDVSCSPGKLAGAPANSPPTVRADTTGSASLAAPAAVASAEQQHAVEQWGQGPARPATQGVSADLHEHQRILQALHSFGMVTADGQLYVDSAALNMGGAQMTHVSRTATTPLPGFAANVSIPPPMSYGAPGMMSAPEVHLDNGHQYVLAAHANRLSAAGQPHNYPPDLMMAMYNGKVF